MKVAFITFEYPPFILGGAGVYAFNVTHELAKLGHEVIVFTPDFSEKISIVDTPKLKIKKVYVNKKLPFKALQFWLHLPKEIKNLEKEIPFDILHFNGISYWFLKKRLSRAKHIVTIHHLVKDTIKSNNLSFISRIRDISGENSFFIPILEKKCIKASDKIIAVSNFTKTQIIGAYNVNSNKVAVIYNGIDLNGYSYDEDKLSKIKKYFNLNGNPILLSVGRVDDPRKDLPFLLHSVKNTLNSIDIILLVVGSGDQTNVRKIADTLGISNNVFFTGFVDEKKLKEYYSLCDIYVCSSKLEGFGLTVAEAMVAGKPIIATKVGAIPEIVKDKINGILVESGDINSMSNAIINLIQNRNLAINIGRANIDYVKSNFNWTIGVKKLEKIYAQCEHQ